MSTETLIKLKHDLENLCSEAFLATLGSDLAIKYVDNMIKSGRCKSTNRMFFGDGHPNDPKTIPDYSLTFAELKSRLSLKSREAKAARSRLIVFAYALWENVYREKIGQECGVNPICSDVFGDLRLYRNAILHHKGKLHTDTTVLKVFCKGDLIEPTAEQLRDIFKQLVDGLNDIGGTYYGEDPSFHWGLRRNL